MGNPLFISASLLVLLLQLANNVEAHQDKHALRQAKGKLKTEVKLKSREHALEHLGNLFKKHKNRKAKKGNKHKKVKTAEHDEYGENHAKTCDSSCSCDISGLKCPDAHMDTDIDYTVFNSNVKYTAQGTTADGRCWYSNDEVSEEFRYMYYTRRGNGWMITSSYPDLDQGDPWTTDNNQVRLWADLEGDHYDTHLYCGHDTGDPAYGCEDHPRGDGRDYYWCRNDGIVSVSCTAMTSVSCPITASAEHDEYDENDEDDEDDDCGNWCDFGHYITEHLEDPADYTIKQTEKKDIESFGKTYLKHSHQFALQGRAFKDETCSPESQIDEAGYILYGNGKSTGGCFPFEGNTGTGVQRWYKESTDGSCWNMPDGTTELVFLADIYEDNMCKQWVANDVVETAKFPAGCFWDIWSNSYKNYRCTEVLTPFNSFHGMYHFDYHNGDRCGNREYPLPNFYMSEIPLGKCEDYITVECSNDERTLTVTEFQPKNTWAEEYMCPMTDKLKTYTFKYSDFDIFNTCQDDDFGYGEKYKFVCIDGSGKIPNRHTEYVNA